MQTDKSFNQTRNQAIIVVLSLSSIALLVTSIMLFKRVQTLERISEIRAETDAETKRLSIQPEPSRRTAATSGADFSKELILLRAKIAEYRAALDRAHAGYMASVATNAALTAAFTNRMSEFANSTQYARELQQMLDDILREKAPDEYARIQQEITIRPTDHVYIGKDIATFLLGASMPSAALRSIMESEGDEVILSGAILKRYAITNYEQLRIDGITNFSVVRQTP